MSIFDFLPAFPWEGPPLPRFLAIPWPWASQQSLNLPKLPSLKQYVTEIREKTDIIPYQAPLATYSNIEDIEFPDGFDPETLMPRRIRIHREFNRKKQE